MNKIEAKTLLQKYSSNLVGRDFDEIDWNYEIEEFLTTIEDVPRGTLPSVNKTTKKTSEQRQKDFMDDLAPFVAKYGKEMVRKFFNHWTEKSPRGKKMRFEKEPTFDPALRLAKWRSNEIEWGKSKSEEGTIDKTITAEEKNLQATIEDAQQWKDYGMTDEAWREKYAYWMKYKKFTDHFRI